MRIKISSVMILRNKNITTKVFIKTKSFTENETSVMAVILGNLNQTYIFIKASTSTANRDINRYIIYRKH